MELLDTTLREGEQCYGVFFPVPEKLRLAQLLDGAGMDFIEAGHPAAAPSIREAAAKIARLGLRARIIGHSRLDEREIRMVRDLGLSWVGLFGGVNPSSCRRYGATRDRIMERIARSITFAKEIGLAVRFTCEDASRTDVGDLADLYGRVRALGADRVSYADTVGIDTPERLERLSREMGGTVPFSALHFHFHNDRGMAYANAVTAVSLGARCIDASIMGLGERMGIVRLEDMVRLRKERGDGPDAETGHEEEPLAEAGALVRSSIDRERFPERRFAHKSGIHIHGVLNDPPQYEHIEPTEAGGRRLIVLSKLIGRAGLRALLARHGFREPEDGIEGLLSLVKSDERLELAHSEEIARYFAGCGVQEQ